MVCVLFVICEIVVLFITRAIVESKMRRTFNRDGSRKEELDSICAKLGISFNQIISDIETHNDLYCIYVGQSHRVLRKRISIHLNSTINRSTLRKSIGALFGLNEIDNFLNKLFLEFVVLEDTDKNKLKRKIDNKEHELINKRLRVLNIKENNYNHPLLETIKINLKTLRSNNQLS